MRAQLTIPDFASPAAESDRRSVAVVGGDVGAAVVASALLRRGHRVVWYRGDQSNPHAAGGTIRDFFIDPVALPGYVLGLPGLMLGNAVRGGLQAVASPEFLAWVLRAVASSRPRAVEATAADRAWLLAAAAPAYRALTAAAGYRLDHADVVTVYRDARAYASGWAAHDVRRRHGCAVEDLGFDDLAQMFPHLSPRYARGCRVARATVVVNSESFVEALKADLERRAQVKRHWPDAVRPGAGEVEIADLGEVRRFDWVVRCEDGGPAAIWPRGRGGRDMLDCCLPYRERALVRELALEPDVPPPARMVLVDGASGAWLEYDADRIVAAGAHRLGGAPEDELGYLIAAAYARIWRDLAARGWRDEGGRVANARGWLAPDSRPMLGDCGGRILMSAGYGPLNWTLAAAAGAALAALVEENAAETEKLSPFSPRRFD
ncbi:hypothetical protein KL86APRO_10741 [uncultured Alphaproteobacteria bacterium]|uniref:FAD dependent oxidoreductase n=1 Tax=uncultured Alphaproteobacteria bacterium TaxID=91750 RepID=A0A212JA32_9PROT|nr:hypothetical protein KL86APRO_10741 [uncultured Alphaproteobacteria bacterium]